MTRNLNNNVNYIQNSDSLCNDLNKRNSENIEIIKNLKAELNNLKLSRKENSKIQHKFCEICKTSSRNLDECWYNTENKNSKLDSSNAKVKLFKITFSNNNSHNSDFNKNQIFFTDLNNFQYVPNFLKYMNYYNVPHMPGKFPNFIGNYANEPWG